MAASADTFGADLIVIDYVQRFGSPGSQGDGRVSMNALMGFLREFADAGCGLIVVSSVARQKDSKGGSSYEDLNIASFRESSELEFGADSAFMLVADPDDASSVTLRCLKNRHGEPVDVALRFDGARQSFTPREADGPKGKPSSNEQALRDLAELWGRTPPADDDAGDDADGY